jgi:type VI protein secretion system component VasK
MQICRGLDKKQLAFLWAGMADGVANDRTQSRRSPTTSTTCSPTTRRAEGDRSELVDRARRTIPADSIPALVYSVVRISYADDEAGALRFDGLGIDRVFRRKSGTSLTQPMPSLYTAKTFERVVSSSVDETLQFTEDRWVQARASNQGNSASNSR